MKELFNGGCSSFGDTSGCNKQCKCRGAPLLHGPPVIWLDLVCGSQYMLPKFY
jgi:hypothetical protein